MSKIRFNDSFDASKCLQQIKIPDLLHVCAPCSELPSIINSMVFLHFFFYFSMYFLQLFMVKSTILLYKFLLSEIYFKQCHARHSDCMLALISILAIVVWNVPPSNQWHGIKCIVLVTLFIVFLYFFFLSTSILIFFKSNICFLVYLGQS